MLQNFPSIQQKIGDNKMEAFTIFMIWIIGLALKGLYEDFSKSKDK